MKNTLLVTFLLGTIIIAGCTTNTTPNNPVATGTVAETGFAIETGTVAETQVPAELNPITQINIYQVQLDGTTGSATGATQLIGCNDTLVQVPVAVNMTEVNKHAKTWDAIVDYDFENMGLVNPWKLQDAVEFDNYEIVGNTLTVNLSGSVKIGGVCDVPRLNETVKATYKNFGYDDVVVLVNGQTIN